MKDSDATRNRLEWLAWLLDSSVTVPGTQFKLGVDSIVGLIPGVGDLVGAALSSYIMAEAARLGVPKSTLIRMGVNIAIDTVIGAVPVAGDVFDMAWKANQRNVLLLKNYVDNPQHTVTASRFFVVILGVVVLAFVIGVGVLSFVLLRWLVHALSS